MFTVNERCTRCGDCIAICPPEVIKMAEQGPYLAEEAGCIRCGHCVAVCPHAALDSDITPLSAQKELPEFPVLDADTAELFLRSRRSIRRYLDQPVEPEKIERLLDVARMAQTGGNRQGISFVAVTDPEKIEQLKLATIAYFRKSPKKLRPVATFDETGRDTIFLGAPCVILAVSDNTPQAQENSRYVITYAELYATALGLGSCWAGFFESFAARCQEQVREILDLDDEVFIGGALMLGYPEYRYHRVVDRDPLDITWR